MQENPSVLDWLFDAPVVRLKGDPGRGSFRRGPVKVRNGREYVALWERRDVDGTGPRWVVKCNVPVDQLDLVIES
jgi:hypothetical protein